MRRVRAWNVTLIDEAKYGGMDTATAGETRVPRSCGRRAGKAARQAAPVARIDRCSAAHLSAHAFATCAVVGSAPSLAFLYQGHEIDSHDAVFRTNDHAIVDTVGKKVTFRIAANAQQLGAHRRHAGSVVQLVPPDRQSLAPGNLVRHDDQVKCVPNGTLRAIYREIGVTFGRRALSTGALAVGIALRLCKSVTVYGFGALQSYDHLLRDDHHDWLAELRWLRFMLTSGRLVDGTDRGVHGRKCEGAALLHDALALLHRDAYTHMSRKTAMPIEHLATAALKRAQEGCAPRAGALRRWWSGAAADTKAVDDALLRVYQG